jgi:hypothetical protein
MVELHFKYDFDTFGAKPKRDVDKIDECKIQFYGTSDNTVELIVLCQDEVIAEKLKHYLIMVYEIMPKKTVKL